ncbi:MAG: carbon storage regulator [bacterium]|nr:carbon storage regulator [bacterium]
MLVLSRKVGEKLIIGDEISIELVRIQGNRIALGLSAPAHIKILRAELESMDAASETPVKGASKQTSPAGSRMELPAVKTA